MSNDATLTVGRVSVNFKRAVGEFYFFEEVRVDVVLSEFVIRISVRPIRSADDVGAFVRCQQRFACDTATRLDFPINNNTATSRMKWRQLNARFVRVTDDAVFQAQATSKINAAL